MKKIILSLILISSSFYAFSQVAPSFQFGVKGGMNLAKLTIKDTFKSDNKAGYFGGVWARIGGGGLFLQPELYLSGKNSNLVTTTGQENSLKFTSLDLPILIGTKIGAAGAGIRLNAGPVLTFMLNEDQKFDEAASSAFKGKFKQTAVALQVGIGFDIGKLSIDGRYESGLSKINSAAGYSTTKLNLYTVGIGFRIF